VNCPDCKIKMEEVTTSNFYNAQGEAQMLEKTIHKCPRCKMEKEDGEDAI